MASRPRSAIVLGATLALLGCSSQSPNIQPKPDASTEAAPHVEAGRDARPDSAGDAGAAVCVQSKTPTPFPMGSCDVPQPATPDAFDEALSLVMLTRCSIDMTTVWTENCFMDPTDKRQLSDFAALHAYPLRLPAYGAETAAWFDAAMSSDFPVSSAIAAAAERRGTPVTTCAPTSWYVVNPKDAAPLATALGTVASMYGDSTFDLATTQTAVKSVPLELQQALVPVLLALANGSSAVTTALKPITTTAVMRTTFEALPYWIRGEATFDTTVLPALDAVDTGAIATAAVELATAVEAGKLARFAGTNLPPVEIKTKIGAVVIHGSGDDTYLPGSMADGAALLLDLGGDDTYKVAAGATTSTTNISVAIDLAGKDTYGYVIVPAPGDGVGHRLPSDGSGRSTYGFTNSTTQRQGGGTLGVGLLFDYGTDDDTYQSLADSQGSGILGVGVLYDQGGNDNYDAEALSQGAAGWGIGLLLDGAGSDTYTTYYEAQGFGFTQGVGALVDSSGDDVYYADPGLASLGGDSIYANAQLPAANTSLTQGAGYGLRPDNPSGVQFAGGMGILRDLSGNDSYTTSVFGQATSFAMGIGILLEGGGDDTYEGLWYVQGSAAHTGLTYFNDAAGNDMYNPTFPIQSTSIGVGHDCSASVHYDEGGDDAYIGPGLGFGTGNDNGVGVMVVNGGTDTFTAAATNTLGAAVCGDPQCSGNPSPIPTLGVFVKAGGTGSYTVGGVAMTSYPGSHWSYAPQTPDGGTASSVGEYSVGMDKPDGGATLP
jgi:hypothetical protein